MKIKISFRAQNANGTARLDNSHFALSLSLLIILLTWLCPLNVLLENNARLYLTRIYGIIMYVPVYTNHLNLALISHMRPLDPGNMTRLLYCVNSRIDIVNLVHSVNSILMYTKVTYRPVGLS